MDVAALERVDALEDLAGETDAGPEAPGPKETNCTDGVDDDQDLARGLWDYDCHDDPACQPDGQPESSEARCSDWVDNNNDGATDCDDYECQNKQVCKGSWDLQAGGGGAAPERLGR